MIWINPCRLRKSRKIPAQKPLVATGCCWVVDPNRFLRRFIGTKDWGGLSLKNSLQPKMVHIQDVSPQDVLKNNCVLSTYIFLFSRMPVFVIENTDVSPHEILCRQGGRFKKLLELFWPLTNISSQHQDFTGLKTKKLYVKPTIIIIVYPGLVDEANPN